MGLLHKDEPVVDATVNCPECRAIDWVVRRLRLGGQPRIVCRACGHSAGPYFELSRGGGDAAARERGRRELERAPFPVYVPDGLPWEVEAWFDGADVLSVLVLCDGPRVTVTTEPADGAPEPAEALRDALADMLGDDGPPPGRSDAAYLLEAAQAGERIDREVGDLTVENGTLRVDGAPVACKLLRTRDAWAAHVVAGDVAVTPAAAGVPIEQLALVRHG